MSWGRECGTASACDRVLQLLSVMDAWQLAWPGRTTSAVITQWCPSAGEA